MTGAGIVRRRGFVIARRCRICGGSWGGAMVVLLALLAALLLAGLAAAVLGAVARLHRAGRAVPLAVAAGLLFAVGASLTKLLTASLADGGIAAAAVTWPGYALAVVSLTGLSLQQTAFAAGSLPATMTAITITDPLLSYLLGITGFGERAPHGGAAALAALG